MRAFFPLALLATSFVGACFQSSTAKLEVICKRDARVIVYDQLAWQQYIAKVLAQDLMDQAGVLEGHRSGAITGPLDQSPWITPFPFVPGHDWQNDKPRWADTPNAAAFPERNDIKVLKGERIIARLINYDVLQRGFEINSTYSCANSFPEVYHIARSKVLS